MSNKRKRRAYDKDWDEEAELEKAKENVEAEMKGMSKQARVSFKKQKILEQMNKRSGQQDGVDDEFDSDIDNETEDESALEDPFQEEWEMSGLSTQNQGGSENEPFPGTWVDEDDKYVFENNLK